MNHTLTVGELIEELWVLYFTVIRSLLLAATAAVHSVALVVSTFFQHCLNGTEYLHEQINDWRPTRPKIFDTGENA